MAGRVERDQPVEADEADDIETILRFLRVFADDHHQAKEESALFPELRRTSAGNQGPLRQMTFEHDQERSLVEGLEVLLPLIEVPVRLKRGRNDGGDGSQKEEIKLVVPTTSMEIRLLQ